MQESGRLVMLAPVVDYVRGAGIAADRKVSEAANKCIGFGHGVVRVYLAEEAPPGQVVGNPRWINGAQHADLALALTLTPTPTPTLTLLLTLTRPHVHPAQGHERHELSARGAQRQGGQGPQVGRLDL